MNPRQRRITAPLQGDVKTRRRLLHPTRSARVLVASRRSPGNDLVLGTILAAIAGAANVGGFFALGQYSSHMTGYLSAIADHVTGLNLWIAALSLMAVLTFVTGSACSSFLINWARDHAFRRQYALPLTLQGVLLIAFAACGSLPSETGRVPALAILCFIMGMQNATITNISGARIRTTHATGTVTDIGIELGRLVYDRLWPGRGTAPDRQKLSILLKIIAMFVLGGVFGVIGFQLAGFLFAVPLAGALFVLGLPGVLGGAPQPRADGGAAT